MFRYLSSFYCNCPAFCSELPSIDAFSLTIACISFSNDGIYLRDKSTASNPSLSTIALRAFALQLNLLTTFKTKPKKRQIPCFFAVF